MEEQSESLSDIITVGWPLSGLDRIAIFGTLGTAFVSGAGRTTSGAELTTTGVVDGLLEIGTVGGAWLVGFKIIICLVVEEHVALFMLGKTEPPRGMLRSANRKTSSVKFL